MVNSRLFQDIVLEMDGEDMEESVLSSNGDLEDGMNFFPIHDHSFYRRDCRRCAGGSGL